MSILSIIKATIIVFSICNTRDPFNNIDFSTYNKSQNLSMWYLNHKAKTLCLISTSKLDSQRDRSTNILDVETKMMNFTTSPHDASKANFACMISLMGMGPK